MTKSSGSRWRLDPREVAWSGSSGGQIRRSSVRASRALDLRGCKRTAHHRPTGVEVVGEVPAGHYTRTELARLQGELERRIFGELEERVARKLRIPGR